MVQFRWIPVPDLAAGMMLAAMITLVSGGVYAATAVGAGRTLHVSEQAIPGVSAPMQFRSIAAASAQVRPGDTVLIHAGVYREAVTIAKSGTSSRPISFVAAPGERVVVTGADRLTDWRRESETESIYSTAWDHVFIGWSKDRTHGGPAPIGRAEQVFVNGYQFHQVMRREQLSPGAFYVDEQAARLFVWIQGNSGDIASADINHLTVEASARESIWHVNGSFVRTSGVIFRYAANHAQLGAATFTGNNCLIEKCVFERTNADGARFEGQRITVRDCRFEDNGFVGFEAARAHGLLMTGCTVRNNNAKNFDRGWGGAGDKIVLSRDVVLERCCFVGNRGVGIWFDIGNERCTVQNCLIADNENGGLFYEISYGLRAHDNVIIGNGFAGGYGSWGVNGGICLSSSPNCVVERNLIIGNAEGLDFREQYRTTPRIGNEKVEIPIWNHDQVVRGNVLAYNVAQAWGWFAVGDGRHWPRSMRKGNDEKARMPQQDIAAEYAARDRNGQPVGLSLESLRLNMSGNLFYAAPGQKVFAWGPSWETDHKEYDDLAGVRRDLGLEARSRCADPRIADFQARDFRIPRDAITWKMGCYPRGEVPGVRLGINDSHRAR